MGAESENGRSLAALLAELSDEARTLLRHEVALARIEMSEKATHIAGDLAIAAVGAALLFAGLLALLTVAAIGLSTLIAPWQAVLAVGGVALLLGLLLLLRGRRALKRHGLAPRQTIASLKEDSAWARAQLRQG